MIHEEEAALGAQALRAGALRGIMVPSPEGKDGLSHEGKNGPKP